MKKNIEFKKRFLIGSLRNVGYEPYSALDEFVDNSIDANAKNIHVNLISEERGKLTSICISDDGEGMTQEQLEEALSFGSDSGKTTKTIGMYGTGMKTAALAMAQRLIVITKSAESDEILTATFDIENIYNDEDAELEVEYGVLDEKDELYKKISPMSDLKALKSGTIVIIDKFDKLPTEDIKTFKGTLIRKLRVVYNKFIHEEVVNIYVCGEKLTFFDPIGYYNSPMNVQKMNDGVIEVDGMKAKWITYHVPQNDLYQRDIFPDFYGRAENRCGLYIYRCNRLVGEHLVLGLFSKSSHWHNGFRMELFLDGDADSIFGTSFNKMIGEKDKTSINKAFYDKLYEFTKPEANRVANIQKAQSKSKEVDETTKKQLEKQKEDLNSNPRIAIGIRKKGRNKKSEEPKVEEEKKEHKKQKNPNPTKKRNDEWFGGFEFKRFGKTCNMYYFEKREKLHYLIINQDHEWYNHIFNRLDDDAKNKIAAWVALSIAAREEIKYLPNGGDDSENVVEDIFRLYDEKLSDEVRLKFFGED